MGIENPFALLVAIFAGGTLLWGLETRKMPVAPFWIVREDHPSLYWSAAASWLLTCVGLVIVAM